MLRRHRPSPERRGRRAAVILAALFTAPRTPPLCVAAASANPTVCLELPLSFASARHPVSVLTASLVVASFALSVPASAESAPAAQQPPGNAGSFKAAPSSYRDVVLADAPLSYWRLGETVLDQAADETNRHPARYANWTSYWGSSLDLLGRPGALANDPNTSVDGLLGQPDYVTGEQHLTVRGSDFEFSGRKAFTLEVWMKPINMNVHTRRVFSGESSAGGANADAGYLVGVHTADLWNGGPGELLFSRYNQGRWSTLKTPLSANRWAHVAATYDGATMRLFVNGELRASAASTIELPQRAPQEWRNTLVMASKQGHWKFYAGGLDEPAVYEHALSPARVAAHYSTGAGLSR